LTAFDEEEQWITALLFLLSASDGLINSVHNLWSRCLMRDGLYHSFETDSAQLRAQGSGSQIETTRRLRDILT
jgi:hypothetical protein